MAINKIKWKFLQDWDGDLGDKLGETSVIHVRMSPGWLIAFKPDSDEPLSWYDIPETDPEEVFRGY